MSSSATYAASPWLPVSTRGWEADDGALTPPAIRAVRHSELGSTGVDSMAREMGQERGDLGENVSDMPGSRDGAPKIKEVHHWGVEDRWGRKAGRWGMGARVYDEEGAEGQAEGRLRWRRGGEK